MAFVIADRVRESSVSTGTGNFTLAGAVTGYQTFASVMATSDTTFYTIADQGGANWEVGIGTFTSPSTLARTTILSSSNGGSVVTFGAGTKDVFISLPASKTNVEDQPNLIEVNSSSAALRITQTGAGNALLVEDSANPDATPFVVNASGQVLIGRTTAPFGSTSLGIEQSSADTAPSNIDFLKNRAGAIVNSGDGLGRIRFWGYDGASNIDAAEIVAAVDGTPGTNDMPGRLVFNTTADGASTVTERMRITNAGNVGIGTASPDALLTVNTVASFGAGAVGAPSISAKGDLDTGMWFPAANTAAFSTGGSERLRIDSNGKVGIGTSNPGARLQVDTATTDDGISITNTSSANTTAKQPRLLFRGTDTVGTGKDVASLVVVPVTADYVNASLAFYTRGSDTNTERMRIDSSGNVGIGTSSPGGKLGVSDGTVQIITGPYGAGLTGYFGTYTNHVLAFITNNTERARIDTSGNLLVGTTSRGPVNASAFDLDVTNSVIYCSHANGKASGSEYIQFGYNGSGIGSITQNGTTAVAYNTSSDYRLKHDVQPLTSGLATIAALKPYTYKWNADNSYGEGFIAHELQAVIPNAVTGEKDAVNEDGSIKPQGVDYSKIVVHLVAAIQELSAKVAALEGKP
jgi:hypothetical protein